MNFDYSTLDNHIKLRGELPPHISKYLLDIKRADWVNHPNYHGKSKFFLDINNKLSSGTLHLKNELEALLDEPLDAAETSFSKNQLVQLGNHIISFAHGHHNI
ncbi:MAG: hypothetical protein HRU28_14330, partial [Rhizobiales bacterium]|nr:hypothetical protein [Hyphomicrobiales bacterium]